MPEHIKIPQWMLNIMWSMVVAIFLAGGFIAKLQFEVQQNYELSHENKELISEQDDKIDDILITVTIIATEMGITERKLPNRKRRN